jgi:hypothetical protein
MTVISKGLSLLAISVALTLSAGPVIAKSGGGPIQVKTSGTSAGPTDSGARDSTAKGHGGTGVGCGHACPPRPRPGYTQPPCRGGHMGPNGVMIQCD